MKTKKEKVTRCDKWEGNVKKQKELSFYREEMSKGEKKRISDGKVRLKKKKCRNITIW